MRSNTVVNFIRSLRGDRALKVHLVGWSRGGMRVIGYAALHPEKIDKVVVLNPTRFPPLTSAPSYPMNMTDKRDFFVDWDRQIDSTNCPQQVDPSIREALWNATIALDKLGSGWGQAFAALPRLAQQDGPPIFRAAFRRRRSSYEERLTIRSPSKRHARFTTRSVGPRRTRP
jgi:pimeloyl-ACP methyl ester carboxylesterase